MNLNIARSQSAGSRGHDDVAGALSRGAECDDLVGGLPFAGQ